MINKYGLIAVVSVMIMSFQSFAAEQPVEENQGAAQQQPTTINDLMKMAGPFKKGEQFIIQNLDNQYGVTVENDSLIVKADGRLRIIKPNNERWLWAIARTTVLSHDTSGTYALNQTISTYSCDLMIDRNREELPGIQTVITPVEAEQIEYMIEPKYTRKTRMTVLGKSVFCGTATIGVLGLSAALYAKSKKSHS